MQNLLENPDFQTDYQKLRAVKLNPARYAAATAYEHCEIVAVWAAHLAALNGQYARANPGLAKPGLSLTSARYADSQSRRIDANAVCYRTSRGG